MAATCFAYILTIAFWPWLLGLPAVEWHRDHMGRVDRCPA